MGRSRFYIAVLAGAVCLAACDNTIDPYVESPAHAFAVFGYLDAGADTQRVRVAAIRRTEGAAEPQGPAGVVTTHLASGDRITWTDSIVTLNDGTTGHVYAASFTPQPGETYVLHVGNDDGSELRAFTHVPETPSFEVGSTRKVGSDLVQVLAWNGIRSPGEVVLSYRLGTSRGVTKVRIPYERRSYSTTGDRLSVLVNLTRDFQLLRDELADWDTLELRGAQATVRALSEEWSEVSSSVNIENGEGFFASVGEFTQTWVIPDSVALQAGFALPSSQP